jgi:hypothetical protein
MSETTLSQSRETRDQPIAAATSPQQCEECMGSGGWFRYEPALEPSPGLLYLSCLQCRGSGRLALARA